MSKLTRNNIAYDLTISPYRYEEIYTGNKNTYINFVFSSKYYLNKFMDQQEENRMKISESLTKRFGYKVENNVLADLVLYKKIEKRGFLLIINGEPVQCQNNITLDGKIMISRN